MSDTARTTAQDLAAAVAGVVGHGCSVILTGSLATGAFRPGQSDIDMLAITPTPLTDRQADDLGMLVRTAELHDAKGIDLHVVLAKVAVEPVPISPLELLVGRYPSGVETARRTSDPDLIVEFSEARAVGCALVGDDPATLIGSVPTAWVMARGQHWLKTWLALADDVAHARFMIETAARIWRFAVDGVHGPKSVALAWAAGEDPDLRALREPDVTDAASVEEVLRAALAASERSFCPGPAVD